MTKIKCASATTLLVLMFSCSSTPEEASWLASLPQPWLLSESEITGVMLQFHERFPDFQDRLRALSLWRVGTPYEIFKLGEEQPPDRDPIFRLDVSDCTSHLLTTLSLAQCRSWAEARRNMIEIHYKPDTHQRLP